MNFLLGLVPVDKCVFINIMVYTNTTNKNGPRIHLNSEAIISLVIYMVLVYAQCLHCINLLS